MRSMFMKVLSVAALSIMVSGCATVKDQKIEKSAADALRGKTVAYTTRVKPDFTAMTPSKAALGIFGAAAMISEGNKIVSSNQVDDPAALIASGVAKTLQDTFAVQVQAAPLATNSDDIAKLAELAKGAQLIVDVQTLNWSMAYFPTDWSHYRVMYTGKVRIIDTQSRQVLAEAGCSRVPEGNAGAPSYDEMTGNGAAKLKAELTQAVNECLQKVRSQTLAL